MLSLWINTMSQSHTIQIINNTLIQKINLLLINDLANSIMYPSFSFFRQDSYPKLFTMSSIFFLTQGIIGVSLTIYLLTSVSRSSMIRF